MSSREIIYPSIWPRYAIIASVSLALLAGAHLFFTGFAVWALGLKGGLPRHVLSFPYSRVIPILVRCVGPSVALPGARYSRQERDYCSRWWTAFGWYAEKYGPNYMGAAMVVGALLAGWTYTELRARLRVPPSEQQATSRWSSEQELAEFCPRRNPAARPEVGAMPMGTTLRGTGPRRPVDLALPLEYRFQHVWVLGVTGAGKTSSAFKRWLATDARLDGRAGRPVMSSVVVDVKHPDIVNFAFPVVARERRRMYVWAPFDEGLTTQSFNFLDYVPDPMDASTAAALILSNTPDYPRRDPFWKGMERQLLSLLIQMVTEEPEHAFSSDLIRDKARHVLRLDPESSLPRPRSLPFVLSLSHLGADEFVRLFEMWPEPSRSKWRDRFATILSADERTLVGAMLGIQQALSVFAERSVIRSCSHSNFRLETLAYQPTTLVIGLPTQPRENRQILTSLFIRQLLDVLGRIGEKHRPHGLPVPVTLYLDEIGTLGYIGNLPQYVATYRDIKVAFVLATQDTSQLVDLFGQEQAEVLMANLHTRLLFGYDLRPAQASRVSLDLGEKVILEPSAEYRGGILSQRRSGARVLTSTRPLLTADELRSMQPFQAAVVLPNNRKAMVYMQPVHEDPDLPPPLQTPPTWGLLYKLNDRVSELIGPPPQPEQIPPPLQERGPEEWQQAVQPLPVRPADPDILVPPQPSPVPAAPAQEEPPAQAPEQQPQEPDRTRGGEQQPPAQPPIDLSEGYLVGFFRALLSGRLSDQRVPDGTPGFVYSDRRGEALVPFGYFMDFGRKAGLQFVELNMRWVAEGFLGPRVSVIRNGKPVNCLAFTRQACRALPQDLQAEIGRRFQRVRPDAVRTHSQQPRQEQLQQSRESQPAEVREAAPAPAQEAALDRREEAAGIILSLPFLHECLRMIRQMAAQFEGHPDFSGDPATSSGRWRHVTRNGEELLLVRRELLAGYITLVRRELLAGYITDLGGRPETVFAVWRAAGVVKTEVEGDRTVRYRITPGGPSYVAFRWTALRLVGFPGIAPGHPQLAGEGASD